MKERLRKIREWMNNHHFPPRLIFVTLGIFSTLWFLIRVIPKPSRAGYPCMRATAPFMSGFVVYLLTLGGITIALRKAKKNIYNARYIAAGAFLFAALVGLVINLTQGIQNSYAFTAVATGPEDGPNMPMGKGLGIYQGRVVWSWNPAATNENCTNNLEKKDWYFKPENTNQEVVSSMFINALNKITGKTSLSETWDELFIYQNIKKNNKEKGYTKGEKIFIKINQGTSRWVLSQEDKNRGYYLPETLKSDEEWKRSYIGATEASPYVVLEILRELVNVLGINQADIAVGDPMSDIKGHNYEAWHKEFPDVVYVDKFSTMHGRTLTRPSSKDYIFYSDKTQSDGLYDIVEKADYLINVANLKPHSRAGMTLTAKNHFGSQARQSSATEAAAHLHYSLIAPRGIPNNEGYHKYRVLVDLMGSKYLGNNTVLYIVDGLFGGGSNEVWAPVKYFMAPFYNDWCNSLFLSQDQVALESVCFDFLRTEWNGINKHDPVNNKNENLLLWKGVDDYLHQAADSSNWPAGILYDPDNSGEPLSSLGAHEHWSNAENKLYSRNLGLAKGIELVSIPDTLVKNNTAASKKNLTSLSFGDGFTAKKFYSALVDDDNTKWFLTEAGIVSFDGKKWNMHNKNRKVPTQNLKDFKYDFSTYGRELWIATPQGATVATLPVDARTGATTYHVENTPILSDNVISVAVGKRSIRWFGTDKGISAFRNKKWLGYAYQRKYPEDFFKDFPITSMATSTDGDTLYAGTMGAGVARVFRNNVDAISGASEYAQWGPILIPSDTINSVFITSDGTQWFGTNMGIARHIGYNTLAKWTTFSASNGLVHNVVQAIAADKTGKLWFGTKGGVSVYDGSSWTSFTENDGLNSNNILCIMVDNSGIVWIGTENGVNSINNGEIVSYR